MSNSNIVGGSGWQDYIVGGNTIGNHPGLNPPTLTLWRDSFYKYQFGDGDQGWFDIHMLHDYKAESKVYLHAHWGINVAGATGAGNWIFKYSPAKGYSQQAFPAETVVSVPIVPNGTQYMHQIDEFTELQSFNTNLEVDSLILCAIELDIGTLSEDPFLFQVDMHVEVDGRLTNEKNFPFTRRI